MLYKLYLDCSAIDVECKLCTAAVGGTCMECNDGYELSEPGSCSGLDVKTDNNLHKWKCALEHVNLWIMRYTNTVYK